MRRIARLISAVTVIAVIGPVTAHSQASDSVRIARLATVGRLFGAVKYFHPAFLERTVTWDDATAAAVERVNAARTDEEYVGAVSQMLASLNDPATHVIPIQAAIQASTSPATKRWIGSGSDSMLVFSIPGFDDWVAVNNLMTASVADVRKGKPVIFDLRGPSPLDYGTAEFVFGNNPLQAF